VAYFGHLPKLPLVYFLVSTAAHPLLEGKGATGSCFNVTWLDLHKKTWRLATQEGRHGTAIFLPS
jgi:hypothetical protein